MTAQTFRHTAGDGVDITVHAWLPKTPPRASVQVVHGMAEHGARYARLAGALNAAGYAVHAQDLRGHGPEAATPGHIDDWRRLVADVREIHERLRRRFADGPHVLFGHSMGSFVVQDCLADFGQSVDAAVLSATDKPPLPLRGFGLALAAIERRRKAPQATSALLQTFSFGAFNRPFDSEDAPARTAFDWLSTLPEEVDAYIQDPCCGFACSTQTWLELLRAIGRVQSPAHRARIPADLPVLLIAGDADPVARGGKGPHALARAYRRDGMHDVSTRLYPGGRHELFNDAMRDDVTTDMLAWLDRRLAPAMES